MALGGGVVGDLAGFVAATYLRGVRLVQVPTTLLAQVDAAVGGKVGVDFRAGKNYVGTFYQPRLVVVDLATLETLPERELRSGAAEVAKYGLLVGGALLERCRGAGRQRPGGRRTSSEDLVADCVQVKLDVVAADEREETGARAVLNLGHTIGHAVEAATALRALHARRGRGPGPARRAVALAAPDRPERGGGRPRPELLDGLGLPARLEGRRGGGRVRPDRPRQEGGRARASATCCWRRSARRSPG